MDDSWIERVRRWMKATGTSQESLAGVLGCSRGAVGHYLAGRRQPTFSLLEDISRAMQVHPAWLLYGIGPADPAAEPAAVGTDRRPPRAIPLLGSTATGPEPAPSGFLDLAPLSTSCYALTIADNDAAPRAYRGEIAVLSLDLEPMAGDEVMVRFTDGSLGLFALLSIHGDRLTLGALGGGRAHRRYRRTDLAYLHRIVAVVRSDTPGIQGRKPGV